MSRAKELLEDLAVNEMSDSRLNADIGSNYCIVTVGDKEYFFSYNTCVAFRSNEMRIKRGKISPTTSKHMGKMGVNNFKEIEDADTFVKMVLSSAA